MEERIGVCTFSFGYLSLFHFFILKKNRMIETIRFEVLQFSLEEGINWKNCQL